MKRASERLFVAAAVVVLIGSLWASEARAQFYFPNRMSVQTRVVPPTRYLDPFGIAQRQAYMINLYGHAMSNVPPYALGYNPYTPYYPYYGSGYSPVYPVTPTPTPYPSNIYFNPYVR
jgi:hypothetical protein